MPGLKRNFKLTVTLALAVSIGFAVAGMVSAAVVRSFALQVAPHASVTDTAGKTATESIVVSRGHAAYELSGDSMRHPKCTGTNGCFQVWPPLKVSSAKSVHKPGGIHGKLGTWRRDGFLQLTLNGHPLYRFANDRRADAATGEGISSFHGTWHVVRGPASSGGTPTNTSSTSSATSTTPCLYPPCY